MICSAYRRIQAMRLMRNLPEAKEKIESGALTLTNASKLQEFLRNAKSQKFKVKPVEILKEITHVSKRECELTLEALLPNGNTKVKVELCLERETIDRLKKLIGNLSPEELMKVLIEEKLKKPKPKVMKASPEKLVGTLKKPEPKVLEASPEKLEGTFKNLEPKGAKASLAKLEDVNHYRSKPSSFASGKRSRYIPIRIRRQVWEKSNARCCFVDPTSKRRCESRRFLEYDHIKSFSCGGLNKLSNLQLLCGLHNKYKFKRGA